MRWVVVTIVVFLVPYTYLNIKYRKPGPAFEPYADFTARAEAQRLAEAGYARLAVTIERPFPVPEAETFLGGRAAEVAPSAGGMPADLATLLSSPPPIVASAYKLLAPAELGAGQALRLCVALRHDDPGARPVGAEVYVHPVDGLLVVPLVESVPEGLQVRRAEETVVFALPAGVLPVGSHRVRFITRESSLGWTLLVR